MSHSVRLSVKNNTITLPLFGSKLEDIYKQGKVLLVIDENK